MNKLRLSLLAVIGLCGAAFVGTAPAKSKGCGCSLPPPPKMENGIVRSLRAVDSLIKQVRVKVNQIGHRDGTSTCTASINFLYNGLRWNTETAIVRYAPVTVEQSSPKIA